MICKIFACTHLNGTEFFGRYVCQRYFHLVSHNHSFRKGNETSVIIIEFNELVYILVDMK